MLVATGIALLSIACGNSSQAGSALAQREDSGSVCSLNESVTTGSGTYSLNVDLSASVALPGEAGVDVVMTAEGAIAAVNTADGSTLYWVNPATGEISRTVELPGAVSDIAFDSGSVMAIASQNTLTRLDTTSGETLSTIALPDVERVAIAPDGHIAAIANKTIYLYDSSNTEMFARERDYRAVTDVEVMSCDSQQAVFVTSFRNARFTDLNNRRNPVQIARLESFDFAGEVQWSLFGDDAETIKQNVADTRLYRATMGRDGYLYIGGESAGTATIFRWRGEPMTEEEQRGQTNPFLSRIDENSSLHNSGAAHLPYYARVHPTEGRLITAQMSFPRRNDTKAGAMRIGDIATGADGTLYFGGRASAFVPNRDSLTLNGVSTLNEYDGGEQSWMAIAPDFQSRKFWTVLAEDSGKGIVQGVDVGYGYSAALSNVERGTVPVTAGNSEGTVFLSFTTE